MMTGGRIIYTGSVNVLFTFTIALLVLYVCRYYDKRDWALAYCIF